MACLPPVFQFDVGSVVKVTSDYTAVREDEISVTKGELIQILSSNQQGAYLVHRPVNETSPAAEGWIPASVLTPKEDNGVRQGDKLSTSLDYYTVSLHSHKG